MGRQPKDSAETNIIGIERLAAAQGCDVHAPMRCIASLERPVRCCARRCRISTTIVILRSEMAAAITLVQSGALLATAGADLIPEL